MHGGRSTGRPIVHGAYTKVTIHKYVEARKLLKTLRDLIEEKREDDKFFMHINRLR